MPTMENVDFNSLFMMFKGEWGTRKSTQALSFPKPQYWFAFDQKMEGIYLPMKLWGIDPKSINYDNYTDWNKAEQKLKELQTKCPFKTIVVDNISAQGDAINSQTLALKSGTVRNTGEEAGKRIAGIPVNTMEDFNAEASAFQTTLKILKDIQQYWKIHVILIAHVMQTQYKTANGQTHFSRTVVTGGNKISAKIPTYCHEVYHFNMTGMGVDKRYSVLTTHSGDDFARTCLPLEKEIVFDNDPLYEKWIVPAVAKMKGIEVKRF